MQRFLQYSPTFIKSELYPRFHRQNLRSQLCSVANPHERIPYLLDFSKTETSLQGHTLANREYFDLLKGRKVAICCSANFGELIYASNSFRFDIDVLIVVPPRRLAREWNNATAASLDASIRAANKKCGVLWLGGRVALIHPSIQPTQVCLCALKSHKLESLVGFQDWPRDGLTTLVSYTSRIYALPWNEVGRLSSLDKIGSITVLTTAKHCGPNFAFLKALAPQLPSPLACLD